MSRFRLSSEIQEFVRAHQALAKSWKKTRLKFTLDGKLVGDIAEAIAAEQFGLKFPLKRTKGVDLLTSSDQSVQVKSSGVSKGPAFTVGEATADYLLFYHIHFQDCEAELLYNGPEAPVRSKLRLPIVGTRRVGLKHVLELHAQQTDRLPLKE